MKPGASSPMEILHPHQRGLGGQGGGIAGLGDQRLGLAVVDDVGDLVLGQVPIDRGDAEAGAQGGAEHLHELGAIGAHQGDRVASLEAMLAQQAHHAVGVGVDLVEISRAEGIVDRDLVRLHIGPDAGGHARIGGLDETREQIRHGRSSTNRRFRRDVAFAIVHLPRRWRRGPESIAWAGGSSSIANGDQTSKGRFENT